MKREARKTRRARRVSSETDQLTPLARLALIAGDSLALSDSELTDAMNALSGYAEPGELADVLHARLLELVELLRNLPEFADVQVTAERAQLEKRRGVGFVQRVAGMGTPAADALSSHKIQGVNSRGLLARARKLLQSASWLRIGSCGGWPRRFMGGPRRRSSSGRRCGFTSSGRRGSRQRSSSGSTSKRLTRSRSSARRNQSTQSDEPPGQSSAHQTRPFLLLRSASCIAKSASAFAVARGAR